MLPLTIRISARVKRSVREITRLHTRSRSSLDFVSCLQGKQAGRKSKHLLLLESPGQG